MLKITHPLVTKTLELIHKKKSNLAVALDVTSQSSLLALANQIGPEICILKTHVDILRDYTPDFGPRLQEIAHKHQFLIFEDRKFADIGNTASLQYGEGLYQIAQWADLINAHLIPGPGVIKALKEIGMPLQRGLLLIAEMSSENSFSYSETALKWAEEHSDFVIGFICSKRIFKGPNFLHLSPGAALKPSRDLLGQTYRTFEELLSQNQTDIVIVGRAIAHAKNPPAEAKLHRQTAWELYAKTCVS